MLNNLIQHLWEKFKKDNAQINLILAALQKIGCQNIPIDHFAIIDLPGPHTGIFVLKEIFANFGCQQRGQGYLPSKQNDFIWMAEKDCETQLATTALPQMVLADFRLDELSEKVRHIIWKYSQQAQPLPKVKYLKQASTPTINHFFLNYFGGRDWPLPTRKEFQTVHEFNELLAWVLIFGRKPNHFTISTHLLKPTFNSISEFLELFLLKLPLPLNENGLIHGGALQGIAQCSTRAEMTSIKLSDGTIELPNQFVEFVWRYPKNFVLRPTLWSDYYTDFLPQQANQVIKSVYLAG